MPLFVLENGLHSDTCRELTKIMVVFFSFSRSSSRHNQFLS
jgi:hypothetical protein